VKIACIGGAHVDRYAVLKEPFVPATPNPATVTTGYGGVARNVAENLVRLGGDVMLVSRAGSDESGSALLSHLKSLGFDTSLISRSTGHTASYTAVLQPNGELILGVADMDIYDEMSPGLLEPAIARVRDCSVWFIDANLPQETIEWLASFDVDLAADATSVAKSRRLGTVLNRISVIFLNIAQAASITGMDGFDGAVAAACAMRAVGSPAGIVTNGGSGIAVWADSEIQPLCAFPAVVRNVTGAGDALIAGTLFGLTGIEGIMRSAQLGLAAAAITVESEATVAPHLTSQLLYDRLAANHS
jgi:pseudouridine kinase